LIPEGELVFDDDNSEVDEENQEASAEAEPEPAEPSAADEFAASNQETAVEAPAAGGDEFDW
jgi:ATP-dependent RNA helicase DDX3X